MEKKLKPQENVERFMIKPHYGLFLGLTVNKDTDVEDETTYTGTSYTLVDISQYLDGTWEKPETHGLTSAADSKEYIVSPRKTYGSTVELETIDFEKALKQNITTGEYKLVFKAYSDNTLVQTVKKTFIVTP